MSNAAAVAAPCAPPAVAPATVRPRRAAAARGWPAASGARATRAAMAGAASRSARADGARACVLSLLGGVALGVCAALLAGGDNARNGQARAREYARAAAADAAAAAEAAALALEGLTGVHSSTAAQPVACKPAPAGSGSDAKVSAACRYTMRPRSRGRLQPGPPTDGSSRARAYLASVLRAAAAICPVRPERSGTGRPRAIRSSRPFSSASPSTARSWRPSQIRPSSRRMGSTACSKRLSPT